MKKLDLTSETEVTPIRTYLKDIGSLGNNLALKILVMFLYREGAC